ncbi:MAG: hypothetical protein ABIG69_04080 [Bacteroidota bacterium]
MKKLICLTIKGVCEGCGGELEPLETVDNAGNPTFWVGCQKCYCFRAGIDPKYFDIAQILISEQSSSELPERLSRLVARIDYLLKDKDLGR